MSTIDKSWTKLGNRNSSDFLKGLRNFIEIAKNHVNSQGKACCPCRCCANSCRQDLEAIYAHIHSHGFLQAYQIWNHHGEKYPNHDEIAALFTRRTHPTPTNNEMFDVIDDVMAEQNTNEEYLDEDETGLDPEFDALFKELNTELYPGCSWMSSLNFLAKLMHIKVINKWTDSSFNQTLELLRVAFPKENHIPASHYEAKKKLRKIGLGYQSIHACINDCALFWKENDSKESCPVCNESRWADKNTKGKKVPKKVLRYFPLTSRLRRRYSSRLTAKDMIWHNTGHSTDGIMRHPVDGKAWQDFDKRYPDFAKEPRNVRLGLAADGFNPFGNINQSYSMWPVVLTTYNTPPWLCMKDSFCNIDTPSCRVTDKIAFVGHRRFLRHNDKLRENLMFDGKKETRPTPRRLNNAQILQQLNSLPGRVPGKHHLHGGVKRKRDASELNWTKRSIFFELDYWSSLELKHNLDLMHVEKNVCESLLGTLLMNDKSKDTPKARQDLEKMGIRDNLWLRKEKNKVSQPHAPYSFKPKDRENFCKFIRGVRLPDGFGSNFKNKVQPNNSNITGLKSHDYHILMQRLLPIGVRAGLPSNVSKAITQICIFFQKVCARSVNVDDMVKAHKEVVKLLCNLELIYPPAFFDIMVHLLLHLPEEAILGGPVYMRWMYPFERYMKKLKAYVRNKAKPEGSIAEGYVADEALTFCSMYLDGMQTNFNRPDRNADSGIPKRHLLVFSSQCRPISAKIIKALNVEETKSLGWFVLNNCDEIKGYKSEFQSKFPGHDLKTNFYPWFKYEANKSSSSPSCISPECTNELKALAHGPLNAYSYTACIVNGVRFVVNSRDERRTTQNSGVVSPGEDGSTWYGLLQDILELNYLNGYSVVVFRCKWFNTLGNRLIKKDNITAINMSREWYVDKTWYDDQLYILATQAKQVFYLQDPSRTTDNWKVVEYVHHRRIWDHPSMSVVNEIDVLHVTQSSDYNLVVDPDCDVGESSARFVNDETYVLWDTHGEGGDPSPIAPIVDDDSFIDDNEEEDENASDEEDVINDDLDNDDDNALVDTAYFSDESD